MSRPAAAVDLLFIWIQDDRRDEWTDLQLYRRQQQCMEGVDRKGRTDSLTPSLTLKVVGGEVACVSHHRTHSHTQTTTIQRKCVTVCARYSWFKRTIAPAAAAAEYRVQRWEYSAFSYSSSQDNEGYNNTQWTDRQKVRRRRGRRRWDEKELSARTGTTCVQALVD